MGRCTKLLILNVSASYLCLVTGHLNKQPFLFVTVTQLQKKHVLFFAVRELLSTPFQKLAKIPPQTKKCMKNTAPYRNKSSCATIRYYRENLSPLSQQSISNTRIQLYTHSLTRKVLFYEWIYINDARLMIHLWTDEDTRSSFIVSQRMIGTAQISYDPLHVRPNCFSLFRLCM